MNFRIIRALVRRYADISLRSKWRWIDLLFFPVTSLLMWGFFTLVAQGSAKDFAVLMLGMQIFWNFAFQSQNNFSLSLMDDIWSNCFREYYLIPATLVEVLVARFVYALARSSVTFIVLLSVASFGFGFFELLSNPLLLLALGLITLFSSVGIGLIVDGLILSLGPEWGFLVWSIMQLFVLFSCPYYPISIFPSFARPFIKMMPFFWVFGALKTYVIGAAVDFLVLARGFLVSVFYIAVSIPFYVSRLKKSRVTGRITKL